MAAMRLAGLSLVMGLVAAAHENRHHHDGDICSPKDTGFHEPDQQAAVCYLGTFLTKVLRELNDGSKKTAHHVRVNLLPWVGGEPTINALRVETARQGNCTVCLGDNATADSLSVLRRSVPTGQLQVYDNLELCWMQLTDAIMDQLPTSLDGTFLRPLGHHHRRSRPDRHSVTPFQQTVHIFRELFHRGGFQRWTGHHCVDIPQIDNPSVPQEYVWLDVCDPKNHGIRNKKKAAVFCYVASFMTKMMWELTLCAPVGDCSKTEQHVRMHFTPYMGGLEVTKAVEHDHPTNETCTACYNDMLCAGHQALWLEKPCCYDNSTTPRCPVALAPVERFLEAREIFDSLKVCYVPFANYFMEALPKVGHWLVAPAYPETPFTAALRITKDIFQRHGLRACRGRHQPRQPSPQHTYDYSYYAEEGHQDYRYDGTAVQRSVLVI